MGVTLIIPGFTPDSCLGLNGLRRAHWRTVKAARDAAQWQVVSALQRYQGWPLDGVLPYAKATVVVTFIYPQQRQRDPDNIMGLCKPLLDCLVDRGILQADDTDHVGLAAVVVVIPGTRETHITIEPLNEEWNP